MVRVCRRGMKRGRAAIREAALSIRIVEAVRTVAVTVVTKAQATSSRVAGRQAPGHVHHMPGGYLVIVGIVGEGLEGHGVVQLKGIRGHRHSAASVESRRNTEATHARSRHAHAYAAAGSKGSRRGRTGSAMPRGREDAPACLWKL